MIEEQAIASSAQVQPGGALRHSRFEDLYALLTGCSLAVFGLVWLKAAGLVSGGVAGLALLCSYFVPLPPGTLFMLLNLPFFLLAGRSLGRGAMARSVFANLMIGGIALVAPFAFRLEEVDPFFAALFGGTLIGIGLLLLARHQAGVGGIGILALALSRSRGWNMGRTQLACDALILAAAMPILDLAPGKLAASVAGTVAVAAVLITFHKPGRYTGC